MSTSSRTVLSIDSLCVSLNGRRIVHDFSASVGSGEVLAIVGESGSGKTTVLRAVSRLLPPGGIINHGSITFDEDDLVTLDEPSLRAIRGGLLSYLFQDPVSSLDPLMRVKSQFIEVIRAHADRIGQCAPSAAMNDALAAMGFRDPASVLNRYPGELSGGMAQRIALAFATVTRPIVLLADEPTSALDEKSQERVLALLKRLAEEQGCGVVLVTHDLGAAARIADRIAVMHDGRLVETGEAAEVLSHPTDPYTEKLTAAVPRPVEHLEVIRASRG